MSLTVDERVELVFMSVAEDTTNRYVDGKFNRNNPNREPISNTIVGRLILKFHETGSVIDKPSNGRPESVCRNTNNAGNLITSTRIVYRREWQAF